MRPAQPGSGVRAEAARRRGLERDPAARRGRDAATAGARSGRARDAARAGRRRWSLRAQPGRGAVRAARRQGRSASASCWPRSQRRAPVYDKDREEHYNLISALHKSLRGSDADAALYWFQRMLAGGEDPKYVVRRLVRFRGRGCRARRAAGPGTDARGLGCL
ncbi:MAG: hypothetical protein WDO24_15320 [Pseudomonadota bacterium]